MAAVGLLADNPDPSEDEIRHGIDGNLCRCTGYHNIVRAIEYAAAEDARRHPGARRVGGGAGMTTTKLFGKAIKRKEDPALIAGTGRYVDDVRLPGELSAAFVRSPYARAVVNSIDGSAALEMPGVHAVYTIEDVRHLGPLLAQVPVGTLKPLLARRTGTPCRRSGRHGGGRRQVPGP